MYSHFLLKIPLEQAGFRPSLLHESGANKLSVCCSARFDGVLMVRRFSTTLLKARLHRRFLPRSSMQFLSRQSCNFKIARVNQVQFSVQFVAAISQGFRTCLKLVATLARQKLHRVAATKIACVNGPLVNFFKLH